MKYTIVPANTPEQDRFVSISDFKECMHWGGEVEFIWKGTAMVRFDMDRAIRFLFMLPTGRKRSGFMIRQMKHWNTWWEKTACAM